MLYNLDKKLVFITLSVIFTTILFEIIMFCMMVYSIRQGINNKIDSATSYMAENLENSLSDQMQNRVADVLIPKGVRILFNNKIAGIFDSFEKQEKRMVKKTNNAVKLVALSFLFIFSALLLYLYESDYLQDTTTATIITLIVLVLFNLKQYLVLRSNISTTPNEN